MAIFHSYVSLPEGNNLDDLANLRIYHWIGLRDNFNQEPPIFIHIFN